MTLPVCIDEESGDCKHLSLTFVLFFGGKRVPRLVLAREGVEECEVLEAEKDCDWRELISKDLTHIKCRRDSKVAVFHCQGAEKELSKLTSIGLELSAALHEEERYLIDSFYILKL